MSDKRQQAIEMRAQGMTNAEIAARFGVSSRTIRAWVNGSTPGSGSSTPGGGSGSANAAPFVEPVIISPPSPPSTPAPSSGGGSGRAKTSELEGFFSSTAGLISVLLAMWICRDLPPVQEKEQIIDVLSLTPGESKAIGKPIARLWNRHDTLAKYGGKLVESEDWKALGAALISYGSRIYPYLRGTLHVELSRPAQPIPTAASNGHSPGGGGGGAPGGAPDIIIFGGQHAA